MIILCHSLRDLNISSIKFTIIMTDTSMVLDAPQQQKQPEQGQQKITAFFTPKTEGAQGTYSSYTLPDRTARSSDPPRESMKAIAEEESKSNHYYPNSSSSSTTPNASSEQIGADPRAVLARVAAETKRELPDILKRVTTSSPKGLLYQPKELPCLNPRKCPGFRQTAIRVLNSDTIDAALSLAHLPIVRSGQPVLVLNMANAHRSGGGWLRGAMAQEEALCYRTSLSLTLQDQFYPIPRTGGIYSPTIIVIRESLARGHGLSPLSRPDDLPLISVASVAAVNRPEIKKGKDMKLMYARDCDRQMMRAKMRVVLRIAAGNNHRVLVLGAFGCGAFGNPKGEVVRCWREVLGELEFCGGWWDTVVFAVMDPNGHKGGNFDVFYQGLNGLMV